MWLSSWLLSKPSPAPFLECSSESLCILCGSSAGPCMSSASPLWVQCRASTSRLRMLCESFQIVASDRGFFFWTPRVLSEASVGPLRNLYEASAITCESLVSNLRIPYESSLRTLWVLFSHPQTLSLHGNWSYWYFPEACFLHVWRKCGCVVSVW